MGCCESRLRVGEANQLNDNWQIVNTLPTFDNVFHVYCNELHIPAYNFDQIPHKKEQMIFMILNLIRLKPQLFIYSLEVLQERCT